MSRILREYAEMRKRLKQKEYNWVRCLEPVEEEDVSRWKCRFMGPTGSAYEGFDFWLEIQVDVHRYPMIAPVVRFRPYEMAHPNVRWDTGEICLDLLKESWTPVYGLIEVVGAVRELLMEPGLESPLELDLAHVCVADNEAFRQLVRYRLIERGDVGMN